jgi:hypothetical protein
MRLMWLVVSEACGERVGYVPDRYPTPVSDAALADIATPMPHDAAMRNSASTHGNTRTTAGAGLVLSLLASRVATPLISRRITR